MLWLRDIRDYEHMSIVRWGETDRSAFFAYLKKMNKEEKIGTIPTLYVPKSKIF